MPSRTDGAGRQTRRTKYHAGIAVAAFCISDPHHHPMGRNRERRIRRFIARIGTIRVPPTELGKNPCLNRPTPRSVLSCPFHVVTPDRLCLAFRSWAAGGILHTKKLLSEPNMQ
jgi:hypothetical protein